MSKQNKTYVSEFFKIFSGTRKKTKTPSFVSLATAAPNMLTSVNKRSLRVSKISPRDSEILSRDSEETSMKTSRDEELTTPLLNRSEARNLNRFEGYKIRKFYKILRKYFTGLRWYLGNSSRSKEPRERTKAPASLTKTQKRIANQMGLNIQPISEEQSNELRKKIKNIEKIEKNYNKLKEYYDATQELISELIASQHKYTITYAELKMQPFDIKIMKLIFKHASYDDFSLASYDDFSKEYAVYTALTAGGKKRTKKGINKRTKKRINKRIKKRTKYY